VYVKKLAFAFQKMFVDTLLATVWAVGSNALKFMIIQAQTKMLAFGESNAP